MAKGHAPSAAALDHAVGDARAAASVDPGRWAPLRRRVEALAGAYGTSAFEGAVGDVVEECKRVNDVVRHGGREPVQA
ncbi:MAG TPA: hypothetical protein VFJ85_15840 [Acidimicrobiales bacterium]|nr:hypothetical protein [Acidimicrobiales bacterium]